MTHLTPDPDIAQTIALLNLYGFDMKQYGTSELVNEWLYQYPATWIRLAVLEALYLGRYKAISVEQILSIWNRRGVLNFHFTHDFERLICRNIVEQCLFNDQLEPQETDTNERELTEIPENTRGYCNCHQSHRQIDPEIDPEKEETSNEELEVNNLELEEEIEEEEFENNQEINHQNRGLHPEELAFSRTVINILSNIQSKNSHQSPIKKQQTLSHEISYPENNPQETSVNQKEVIQKEIPVENSIHQEESSYPPPNHKKQNIEKQNIEEENNSKNPNTSFKTVKFKAMNGYPMSLDPLGSSYIHKFNPKPDPSQLYYKLKALIKQNRDIDS